MKPGPRPVPTKLMRARGSRRPINSNEPKPATSRPSCPAHLSTAARTEWKRVSAQLMRAGLLTQLDRAALAIYCAAYGRWLEAKQKVAETGLVVTDPKGNVIQNPYLGIANRAAKQMHEILVEFGMTPRSRTGVTTANDPLDRDEKASFFPDYRGSPG